TAWARRRDRDDPAHARRGPAAAAARPLRAARRRMAHRPPPAGARRRPHRPRGGGGARHDAHRARHPRPRRPVVPATGERNMMTQERRGPFLVAVYADVTPGAEADYNRWYDTRHIPQRLALPGYLAAARYERTVQGKARYMAFYELAHAAAPNSPAARALNERPDDWDRRVMATIHLESRAVYERILCLGDTASEHAPFVLTVRIDIAAEFEDDFNRWY